MWLLAGVIKGFIWNNGSNNYNQALGTYASAINNNLSCPKADFTLDASKFNAHQGADVLTNQGSSCVQSSTTSSSITNLNPKPKYVKAGDIFNLNITLSSQYWMGGGTYDLSVFLKPAYFINAKILAIDANCKGGLYNTLGGTYNTFLGSNNVAEFTTPVFDHASSCVLKIQLKIQAPGAVSIQIPSSAFGSNPNRPWNALSHQFTAY